MSAIDKCWRLLRPLILTVMFLPGLHGISQSVINLVNAGEQTSNENESKLREIETLLERHDSFVEGGEYPDSAVMCTIEALQLADSLFGKNSEKYISIFCDYMLEDAGLHEPLIESFYPFVTEALDPKSKYIWRAYYQLAYKMRDIGDYDKVFDLFERVVESDCPSGYKCAVRIAMADYKYDLNGENPLPALIPLFEEIEREDYPDRGELNMYLADVLSNYFLDIEDYDNLINIVEFGEKYADYAPARDLIILLSRKATAYLQSNHIKAIECYDKIIEIASKSPVQTQSDRNWLTIALIQKGDYCYSHLLDFSSALNYYLQALDVSTESYTKLDRVSLTVLNHLNHLALGSELNDLVLQLGELLFDKLTDEVLIDESKEFILSIVNAYIDAGKFSKADELLNKCEKFISPDTKSAQNVLIYHAAIESGRNNYAAAVSYLDTLMSVNPERDVKLKGLRYLKNAYDHLADSRAGVISDSIIGVTKEIVSQEIKLISPTYRANWIALCEESMPYLLTDMENERAIRDALELNLFKKNLLLRTSNSIKRNIIENHSPNYKEQLQSIHRDLINAISRGDSLETERLRGEYAFFEQSAVNEFLGKHSILEDIDVTLDDVLSRLDDRSVAVDFISISEDKGNHLGAFVFSKKLTPRYVPLFFYEDTIPVESINQIWSKIIPLTQGYDELYFCGDGPINSLPIEFSKVGEDRHLGDVIKPHRVFHLSEISPSANVGGKICFVGVANHNASAEDVESNWRGNWTDLPNVRTELETLTRHFSSDSLLVLFNEAATEQAFTALDQSPVSTLHISTHGVFRNEKALIESSRQPASDDYFIAQRTLSANETSLSAIILHSGNKYWKSPYLENNMDDILTADEIELMQFPELNLTVLSACESGLGQIDSEGVWGLQRAFRIAGTKSLICALSKVDDYWTAQFMDAFYEMAADGNSIYDSFQTAQKWLRRELPDNPEIWSSFILIE